MMPEDFFTLVEMKNGLSTLARVEELVFVLQKQKYWVGNNIDDVARHLSAVAHTLAATECKDCLNHYVQLNGINIFNQWLEEALKCSDYVSDGVLEELVIAILRSLERLPINREKLSASQIRSTIERMLDEGTFKVKEEAKVLLDKWNHAAVDDIDRQDTDKSGTCQEHMPNPVSDANTVDDMPSRDAVLDSPLCKATPEEGSYGLGSLKTESQNSNITRCSESSQLDMVDVVKITTSAGVIPSSSLNSLGSSIVSNSCQENFSITEESSFFPTVSMASTGTCHSPNRRQSDIHDQCIPSMLKDINNGKVMEVELNTKDGGTAKSSDKEKKDGREKFVESYSDSQELGNEPNRKISFGVHPVSLSYSLEVADSKLAGHRNQTQEVGLECREIDALEVARQVANEVEREVVDYREASCGSYPEVSSGGIAGVHGPDLVEGNKDERSTEEQNVCVSPTAIDPSNSSPPKDGGPRNSGKTGTDPLQHQQNVESPKSIIVDQESVGKIYRSHHQFDLNNDIYAEDFDCSTNPLSINPVVSAPIAVLAATKGAPHFPITPLRFDGEMGWRGSAATSAFRPASPQRIVDGEKTCAGTKEKQKILEIDLNVAESEHDLVVYPISTKEVPISSGFTSGESCVEICSGRAKKLNLDLNRHGDEDVPPHLSSYWRFAHQNGDRCPPASSTLRQPSMRDFDLNDNPSFFDAGTSCNFSQFSFSKASGMYGSTKDDDPVITVRGMAVEKKDYVNQPYQFPLGCGPSMETFGRTRMVFPYAYMPSPPCGHNAPATAPSMSTSMSFYGPVSVPYVIDSRGATVVPQILGTSGLNGAASSRPPFVTSSSSNGAEFSQTCLDLNFGMTSGENRDSGSFRQLVIPVHNGYQTATASQPSMSGLMLKRKDPDWGREPNPFSHRKMTSRQ